MSLPELFPGAGWQAIEWDPQMFLLRGFGGLGALKYYCGTDLLHCMVFLYFSCSPRSLAAFFCSTLEGLGFRVSPLGFRGLGQEGAGLQWFGKGLEWPHQGLIRLINKILHYA